METKMKESETFWYLVLSDGSKDTETIPGRDLL